MRDQSGVVDRSALLLMSGHSGAKQVSRSRSTRNRPLEANPRQALTTPYFVVDDEFGWGRFDPLAHTTSFFDSPTTPEVVLPAAGRVHKMVRLPAQERVWWFDGERWMVGRVNTPRTSAADAYFVDFPNGRTEAVPTTELRVRWSLPMANPLGLLKAGTVETRFFHSHRTRFLHSVTKQRSVSRGLGGLLSSAVEIHDHQVGAARRVLSDPVPRYLLADEVGLGKTIEAGMVLRQLMLDSAGAAIVIVPDQIVGQWKSELVTKFRIGQFPGRVRIVGHSGIDRIPPHDRLLTIVDEAHRFTDHVNYSDDGERERQYQALRAIAHASKALLLLSATPVRSNEDAFLGLLHLLDPENYPLSDVHAFRRRVEMRDDLAQAMSAVNGDMPLRYLDEPLAEVTELLPDDPVVEHVVSNARRAIADGQEEQARTYVNRVRIHVSETYRLHRRMIRNRRSTVVKKFFPARGRELGSPWLVLDPDPRRRELFSVFEDMRLELEMAEHPSAGRVLQVLLGRILAPVAALEDLVAALRGAADHDLSPDELAVVAELRESHLDSGLAGELERLLADDVEADRLSAAVDWARRRVGRGKYAIACTYPNTAHLAVKFLTRELGSHRVTALLEGQSHEERARFAAEFARSSERSVLVIDRSAEEGANLQFIGEVLHLNLPTSTSRLEQRLGRFDRWSDLSAPVKSVVFEEAEPRLQDQFGAWAVTLNEVFGAFTASTSTLQYVLSDLEKEFFAVAGTQNLADARDTLRTRAGMLEEQRRRIVGQDLLDSIEDRADDEELAHQLAKVDASRRDIEKTVVGYVHEMLGFKVDYEDDRVRFRISTRKPPLLTESTVQALGTRVFEHAYTADRIAAGEGQGFLRWGEPLVNAFAEFAERDDRGRAFAVEVQQPSDEPDRAPGVAFCFDIKVGPCITGVAIDHECDEAFARAVGARTSLFLPTTVERVWWLAGRGRCAEKAIAFLERTPGINLGSRPERFRELTTPFDWTRACQEAFEGALTEVRDRDRVVRRLADARERASAARTRENAITIARSQSEGSSELGRRVMDAVDQALTDPVFTLESCGAVFITWTGHP